MLLLPLMGKHIPQKTIIPVHPALEILRGVNCQIVFFDNPVKQTGGVNRPSRLPLLGKRENSYCNKQDFSV